MITKFLRRVAVRASVGLAVASFVIVGLAEPVLADTSQASGQAAAVQLLGLPVVSSGAVVVSSDGTSRTRSGNSTPALSVLGVQSIVSAGSLFQDAVAGNDGTSAGCAGVVGANGAIQIGPSLGCVVSGAPTGVVLNLGLAVLRADVITAGCTANSNRTTTGSATLANARITDPTGLTTFLSLPVNPAPNTLFTVPGIADVAVNEQSSAAPGQLSVTALDLSVLGGVSGGAKVLLGMVTCGSNAQTAPIPLLSSASLPVAGATVLAAVAVLWFIGRRRSSTPTDA